MKTKITDWNEGLEIKIIPETVEEVALLLKYSLNANFEKPGVNLYFLDGIHCRISLAKRKVSVQKIDINPNLK